MKDWKDILYDKIKDETMTFKSAYLITYWAERNDEATDIELIVYAYNEIEARKQFLDMNITHKKIESIKEFV